MFKELDTQDQLMPIPALWQMEFIKRKAIVWSAWKLRPQRIENTKKVYIATLAQVSVFGITELQDGYHQRWPDNPHTDP
jgi:hypothetical protein